MKQRISKVQIQFNPAFGNKAHVQLEFLQYEIWKFTIECSKNKAKLRREKLSRLEVKLKEFNETYLMMKQKNSIMLTEAKLMKSITK